MKRSSFLPLPFLSRLSGRLIATRRLGIAAIVFGLGIGLGSIADTVPPSRGHADSGSEASALVESSRHSVAVENAPMAAMTPPPQPQSPEAMDGFAAMADAIRSSWGAPGLAVAVVRDGKVIFSQGFGWRNVERRLPVTAETLFSIGSTTKSFTATALAMLVDEGKLDLDEPLLRLVPGFRLYDEHATQKATARDLLCHRTGLPAHFDLLWLLAPMSRRELFDRLRFLGPGAALRKEFQYSNLGYSTAGVILEHLSATPWEQFVTDRILRPLEMKETGFGFPDEAAAEWALPYAVKDGLPSPVPLDRVSFRNIRSVGPAGSIHSNLRDMTQWLLLHLNRGEYRGRRLVSKGMIGEMQRTQTDIQNPGYRMLMQADGYGLGWALSEYRGHRVVDHGGNLEAYSALVSMMPEINAGVVALSNSMNLLGYAVSRHVYDRLLGLEPEEWNNQLRSLYFMLEQAHVKAAQPPSPDTNSPAPLPMQAYVGKFTHPAFGEVTVAKRNDSLFLDFASNVRADLHHLGLNTFKGLTGEFYLPAIEVRFVADGGVIKSFSLLLQQGTSEVLFTKVD